MCHFMLCALVHALLKMIEEAALWYNYSIQRGGGGGGRGKDDLKSNRKARNWSNQKDNPALKTKTGNR